MTHRASRRPSPISRHPVSGVVLAAGAGTRMGRPKLLLPVDGRPLLAWVVDLVDRLPLDERVIVLGAEMEAVCEALFSPHPDPLPPGGEGDPLHRGTRGGRREHPGGEFWVQAVPPNPAFLCDLGVLDGKRAVPSSPQPSPARERGCRQAGKDTAWRVLNNPHWQQGLGSSLRRAAEAGEGGLLVFLGDMPWVSEEAARAVLARAGDRPVAPMYGGRRGFPVYLPSSLRPQLQALGGDQGARDLLRACDLIPWSDDGVIRDVDRVEDLLRA